jgi:hypothetical protein
VPQDEWFTKPRKPARGPFWTDLQALFYRDITQGSRMVASYVFTTGSLSISWQPATGVNEEEIRAHLTWLGENFLCLLFGFLEIGLSFSLCFPVSLTQLTREQISIALEVPLVPQTKVALHEICYLSGFCSLSCPHRWHSTSSRDSVNDTLILSHSDSALIPWGILDSAGYGETISGLQQWLLSFVMGHVLLILRVYCFVNGKRMPYAHIICYFLAMCIHFPQYMQRPPNRCSKHTTSHRFENSLKLYVHSHMIVERGRG